MEDLYSAIYDLKASIDKQNELQKEANGIMRGLVDAVQGAAQELEDLRADRAKSAK